MKSNTNISQVKNTHPIAKLFIAFMAIVLFNSHDLYIKMETYFLQPNQKATLRLYNGTFEKSENIITRNRMLDASVVAHGSRTPITDEQWHDQDSTITQFTFTTGNEGTYVVGVSTKPNTIKLSAEEFNSYLEHDGVLDMLEYRKTNNLLATDAVESYQKHVKAIYQVGNETTNDWSTELGYPIEFVPLANPYEKFSGETIDIKLLLDGKPLTNQLVYAAVVKSSSSHTHEHDETTHTHEANENTHEHSHDSAMEETHTHTSGQQVRTNEQGICTISLAEEGIYYLRTIYMVTVPDDETFTHKSKWATLTFEVSHKHDSSTHTHDAHSHEEGIPIWIFVLGSILLVGLLFVAFRKK